MAYPNHTALGQGLKIYTDALRGFVQQRLIAAYPNAWWEAGVISALSDAQKASIKKSLQDHPNTKPVDHLDAGHLARLITSQFEANFKAVFGEFHKTQNLLGAASVARNEHAHPRSGDMQPDEVAQPLYAMWWVLSTAKLPEAEQVEAIRKSVLGIGVEPAPSPGDTKVAPAPAGQLPFWWQVNTPHEAFQNPASIDESLFAATLGGVFAKSARPDYLDPELFFSHTYFTENLKQTIRDVASRLNGGEGPAVTEMQTPFGGGKTHALLALYHLVHDPAKALTVPGVQQALGNLTLPPNARVIVFDGQEYGTEPVMKENGAAVSTLWGELAFQVNPLLFHQLLSESDVRGEAPGNAIFRQVLQAASPCLILIDELVSYLVKLRFANTRRTQNLYRQTVQFLQEMLQEAGNVPGACVLFSLPKSRTEFGGIDPQQLNYEIEGVSDLQARTDRVVSKRTPVNDDEVYTLMSRRLFKQVDPQAAKQVAQAYRHTYEQNRGLYEDTVLSPEYLDNAVAAYPLHPELIDVLYKKWSTSGDFPRTRAVLQLLANVVADQWVNRREAYAIQTAHVSLERERVRTRIVSAAGGGYDAVVAADIIGGDAHADVLDQRKSADYERFHIARGIATTILMHSFGGATRTGALEEEIRLGTVAPNLGPQYVEEVLDSIEQSLWYVHREGQRLRFQTRPNIYRVIARRAEEQPGPTIAERLKEIVSAVADADKKPGLPRSTEGFGVLPWAASDGVIADRSDPWIAILDAKYAVAQENGGLLGRDPIDQLWSKHGGGFRNWRNALILVAPDREQWGAAESAMREVLAYERVIADAEKGQHDLSQNELKELRSRFADKKDSLRSAVTSAYRWVLYPGEQELDELSLPTSATKDERIAVRVVERLANQDYGQPKILRKMGAVYFNAKLGPRLWKDDAIDLAELSRSFSKWTYLPILPDREKVILECIREGLVLKLWGVAIGDNDSRTYQRLVEQTEDLDQLVTLFDGSASLLTGEWLTVVRDSLKKPTGEIIEPPGPEPEPGPEPGPGPQPPIVDPKPPTPPIPTPKRYTSVRLRVDDLPIGKTSNLQLYLFKALQQQDAGAQLRLTIEVQSTPGIPAETLDRNIVEGLEQLGITVTWEPS
jgi:hypothetical protein